MGVILKEEYVCDYCGKTISGGDVLLGRLAVRKQGARGLGKEYGLAFHAACSGKLTQHASSVPRQRRGGGEGRKARSQSVRKGKG